MTKIFWVGAFVVALVGSGSQRHEVRAVYRLGGQPTGSYREVEDVGPGGEIDTTIETSMVFNRLGSKLEIKSKTLYREDIECRFLGMESDQSSSQQGTHVSVKVLAGGLTVSTTSGGKTYDREVSYSGRLLGPEGARRLVLANLRRVGDSASYQTFSPEVGAVATFADKVTPLGKGEAGGLRLEQTFSAMPGKSILRLDSGGWLLSQSTPSPFGDIVAVRTKGVVAAGTGATLPAEMFTKSIVTSNIRLPEERLIDRLKIKITQKRPDLGWPDLSAPNQRVVSQTKDTTILEITRPVVSVRPSRPETARSGEEGCLRPNALLQSDDAGVKAIVAKVVKPTDDSWAAVRALQRWTNDNMHFDLGIAIAPASEVAKNRRGTCFGYSMLLGSLVRAAGVPSRVRMGMVYAGGIWGGHAWVDVLIGDKWIPVDGALYGPGPADAARFSCYTNSMEDNSVASIGGLASLFGRINVEVLEYSVGGKRVIVPPHAAPYRISGNSYWNPWLGFGVKKPSEFRFVDTDVTWPQATLAAMKGRHGLRIEVQDLSASLPTGESDVKELSEFADHGKISRLHLNGRDVLLAGTATKAAMLLGGRGSQWLLTATGPGAESVLKNVASTVIIRD